MKEVKKDCFGYFKFKCPNCKKEIELCSALNKLECATCKFYKRKELKK